MEAKYRDCGVEATQPTCSLTGSRFEFVVDQKEPFRQIVELEKAMPTERCCSIVLPNAFDCYSLLQHLLMRLSCCRKVSMMGCCCRTEFWVAIRHQLNWSVDEDLAAGCLKNKNS